MNKDIINKYKLEFEHWLNGGKLLGYYPDDTIPQWLTIDYDEPSTFFAGTIEDCTYIINDEYVELRKALAEGKTIQVNVNKQSYPEWKNSNNIDMLNYVPSYCRIKPDEPQFKVGDWVEITTCKNPRIIKQVISAPIGHDTVTLKGNNLKGIILISDIKPWQPQPNEWCWFWHSSEDQPQLLQLMKMDNHTHKYLTKPHGRYYYCEPFIGTLPTTLKD